MSKPLTRLEAMKGMRISTWEAMLATFWISLALGTVPQGFGLAFNAPPVYYSYLTAAQALAGLATLFGALITERRSERRRFCAFTAGGGRALWFLPAIAALYFSATPALTTMLLVTAVSWILIQTSVPAWTSWMNDLVPTSMRGRYFAQRSSAVIIVAVVCWLLVGRFLDAGEAAWGFRPTFAILFGLAGVLGVLNIFMLLWQPEPPMTRKAEPIKLNLDFFREPMRNKPFKLFVLSWAGWGFAQSVAGAYFGVYALQILKFSFFQLQLFNSFAALCQFAAAPVAGYLIDKYGNRPIYTLSYLVITTVPLLWVFTRVDMPVLTFSILFVAQILSGVCGGAMGLAQFNMLLGLSPSDQMPRYSAVLSTIAGAAGVVGPLIGGAIAQATKDVVIPAGGWDIGAYKITFLVSTVLRWMLIPIVLRLSEPKSQEPMDVLGSLARSRPHRSLRHLRRLRGPARPEERASSAQALGRMKERLALEELVEALEDPVLTVRRQATIALGELGDPRALEPLVKALREPDAGLRIQAVVALGKLGHVQAAGPILEVLKGDGGRDPAFTQAAAQTLGRLRVPEAAAPLLEIAEEMDNPSRAAAIQSLGTLGAESAVEPLSEMLRSDENLEPAEISALGEALAKLGDEDAVVPMLQRVASAPSSLLRRELANSAGELIGHSGEFYSWLATEAFAREQMIATMLTNHTRDMRKRGLLFAPRRVEAALAALSANDSRAAARHLLIAYHKAGPAQGGPAEEALEWIAARARTETISEEEMLLAQYAFDLLLRERGTKG